MNPTNFYERTRLFNNVINEINQVESNYSTELKYLNIKLAQKIEEFKLQIEQKLLKEKEISNKIKAKRSKTMKNEETENSNKILIEYRKTIKENITIKREEKPLIDRLISEELQNLLNFYQKKYILISKQVSKLNTILFKFTSTQKKYDPDISDKIKKGEIDFDTNYLKLMKTKTTYFKKMSQLEIYFHQKEKDKKTEKMTELINDIQENGINGNNKETLFEKQKIEELVNLRQNYKKYLVRISNIQKEYIDKINEFGNDIKTFNIAENNLLFYMLKTFEEKDLAILRELNNICLLCEKKKKSMNSLNFELSNALVYDDRVYKNYIFEEYVPIFRNINDQKDMNVIQKMSELIGFEYDKIKINNSNNNAKSDIYLNYQNIDNNLLFILLMGKLTGGESILTKKEKDMMFNLLTMKNI